MRYIISFLISILFATNAMADQLIVESRRSSYVLDVENSEQCITTIINLSNIDKYSWDPESSPIHNYFKKEFTCIGSDGIINEHSFIYQIPYSRKGKKMCLRYSKWSDIYLTDECEEEGFRTRPVIFNGSLKRYILEKTVD